MRSELHARGEVSKSAEMTCVPRSNVPLPVCQKHILAQLHSPFNCPPFYALVFKTCVDIYMIVGKAAHTSIQYTLHKTCRFPQCRYYNIGKHWNKETFHSAMCIDEFLGYNQLLNKKLTITAFVREPMERTVSGMREALHYSKNASAAEFIRAIKVGKMDRHFTPQVFMTFPTTREGWFYPVTVQDMKCAKKTVHKTLSSSKRNFTLTSSERQELKTLLRMDYICLFPNETWNSPT